MALPEELSIGPPHTPPETDALRWRGDGGLLTFPRDPAFHALQNHVHGIRGKTVHCLREPAVQPAALFSMIQDVLECNRGHYGNMLTEQDWEAFLKEYDNWKANGNDQAIAGAMSETVLYAVLRQAIQSENAQKLNLALYENTPQTFIPFSKTHGLLTGETGRNCYVTIGEGRVPIAEYDAVVFAGGKGDRVFFIDVSSSSERVKEKVQRDCSRERKRIPFANALQSSCAFSEHDIRKNRKLSRFFSSGRVPLSPERHQTTPAAMPFQRIRNELQQTGFHAEKVHIVTDAGYGGKKPTHFPRRKYRVHVIGLPVLRPFITDAGRAAELAMAHGTGFNGFIENLGIRSIPPASPETSPRQ